MLSCFTYLAFTGLLSFFLGRLLPKQWFHPDHHPYLPFRWEHGGRVYNRLHIKSWQTKLPDMSKIVTGMMPRKEISEANLQILPRMVQETCVAEFIHVILCFTGLHCLSLWKGLGGFMITTLNTLANLIFVVIQRYNRPRLVHLLKTFQHHQAKEVSHARFNSEL